MKVLSDGGGLVGRVVVVGVGGRIAGRGDDVELNTGGGRGYARF